MEQRIPLFPLKMVPFPGEEVNLHVFEPRYKDLINDILASDKRFGIPPFIKKNIDYGTLMELTGIKKRYEDGRLDISTRGLKVFKIIQYDNPAEGKSYAEGYVKFLVENYREDPLLKYNLIDKLEEFFKLIDESKNVILNESLCSFDIIHKIGLPIEYEYEILKLEGEIERQEYLLNFLDETIPVLRRAEKAKQIIKMNGHFRYFDPISFK
jgi:hypothetical protein